MSLEKIQQALIGALVTAFPDWSTRIAWENKTFKAPPAVAWMAVTFMPVSEVIATLGVTGQDLANGLFQIDLNYPLGAGEADSRKTINLLRTCYSPGILQYEGQAVTILGRTRSRGFTNGDYYKIPFTVRWRSHLTR